MWKFEKEYDAIQNSKVKIKKFNMVGPHFINFERSEKSLFYSPASSVIPSEARNLEIGLLSLPKHDNVIQK